MRGYDKLRHQIYLAVYYKYDNNIIPDHTRIISTYLLSNPNKINLYINQNIHVGMILEYLATKDLKKINILEEVINYVEVICKTT